MYRPGYPEPQPTLVSTFDVPSEWAMFTHANSAISGTWIANTYIVYEPIVIQRRVLARAMWWANGATVTSNMGAAIYTDHATDHKPDRLLVQTASTAQSGTDQMQVADITDTVLVPGIYWLALCATSVSSTIYRVSMSIAYSAWHHFQQGGVTPGSLPATASPGTGTTNNVYVFGFATHSVYGG